MGLFDQELYVEHGDKRFGPFAPVGGPIPLHKYRRFQKSKAEERADRVAALAKRAIADEIGMALAKLASEDRAFIDTLVRETLAKDTVLARVRARFKNRAEGDGRC